MKTTDTPKALRTNSKAVRDKVRAHIVDCVTDDNGDSSPSLSAAAHRILSEFDRVANYPHNVQRFPQEQERFRDYMMGLPFSFEFYNDGIAEFLNGLGINPSGREWCSEKSSILYHYLIYSEVVKAAGM